MKSKDARKRKKMQNRGELAVNDLVDSLIFVPEGYVWSMALSSFLMVMVTMVLLDKTCSLTTDLANCVARLWLSSEFTERGSFPNVVNVGSQ